MDESGRISALNAQAAYLARQPRYSLNEHLVLTDATRVELDACIALLRFHKHIYEDWNFGSVDPQGCTAIVNFFGPPGTGKTLAAEALAGTLGMPFLAVTIVDLESSLKGQMAKNIKEAFRVAFEEQALLFFDEADALLGKRIAVSQGIDSDINATRNTIMTELSAHSGLVVFATNYPRDYDEAIRSRITHQVNFELPDEKARVRLWDRFVVKQIPLSVERDSLILQLAALSGGMSGRDILNCMRKALPRALLDAEVLGTAEQLDLAHLETAILQVRHGPKAKDYMEKPLESDTGDGHSLKRILGMQ